MTYDTALVGCGLNND